MNLIMPQLRVKIKEEMMDLWESLDELSIAAGDISQGINALGAMALGLSGAKDPYAQGLHALYSYLFDANLELHKHLKACRNTL